MMITVIWVGWINLFFFRLLYVLELEDLKALRANQTTGCNKELTASMYKHTRGNIETAAH